MSLVDNANGLSAADVAAVVGNGANNGFGYGEGGWFWIVILFLFFMQNGWGNGFGNNAGAVPYLNADVQRGFDQTAVMGGLNGLTAAVNTGFGDVQTALCGGFAGVNAGVSNGFAQAEIAANARQMANMNQDFAAQTTILNGMNDISAGLQNCCCENRAATADLKYTVATEACNDRQVVNDALRDVISNQTALFNNLQQTMYNGFNEIKAARAEDKYDALKNRYDDLQRDCTLNAVRDGQNLAADRMSQEINAQTAALLRQLNPTPVPAYAVQNPNGCNCGQINWGNTCCGVA